MKRLLKRLLLPKGRKLWRIKGGLAKGILMHVDLQHRTQRLWGFEEIELAPALRKLIPLCKSLVDVGSNDGYYTLIFLKSGAERVIACEAGPSAEELLANAAANGWHPDARFQVVRRLIGQGDGYLPVAEVIAQLPRPILLKIDVDGDEGGVLRSVEASPHLKGLLWLVETHSRELEEECLGWFQARGYRTEIISRAWWRALLPEFRPILDNRWLLARPD